MIFGSLTAKRTDPAAVLHDASSFAGKYSIHARRRLSHLAGTDLKKPRPDP